MDAPVWDFVWTNEYTDMHVVPPFDVIGHETERDCVCGPTTEDMGGGDTAVLHHALDGRE